MRGLHDLADLLFGYDYFISYAHADGRRYAAELSRRLEALGFSVFLDERVYVAGDDLHSATRRRIRMSKKLVVIVREHALRSEWVGREIEVALAGGRAPIAIDINGYVSEGSGENIFVIYKGDIYTPPLANSILGGITRNCALTIARDLGYTVTEMTLPREMLYLADEIFFTGTAAEITPVRSVDRMDVGEGRRGPITKAIQDVFFGIVRGELEDKWNWLTPVTLNEAVAGD